MKHALRIMFFGNERIRRILHSALSRLINSRRARRLKSNQLQQVTGFSDLFQNN